MFSRLLSSTKVGCALVLLAGTIDSRAADYYVANSGNDAAKGDSIQNPWRSIERINRATFAAGDRVLLAGGQSFEGQLKITLKDCGIADLPLTVGSYGEGRATILAGKGTGVVCENFNGIVIENLIIAGAGRTNNGGFGIRCDNTLTNRQLFENLIIRNVETAGFGVFGVLVAGDHGGFRNICVTNCAMHDNLRGGMEIAGRLAWDSPDYCHENVLVTQCRAFSNTGDPNYLKNHSGSGIVLYQVDGGTIEHCTAWNNGGLCRSSGGGVGLWLCACRKGTIQYCESFANRTSGGDGGGFDIDGGCIDCTLQYNYSHDNDGPGLMICSYQYAQYADRGSVIRFNVSENDSRKGKRYAGLWIRTEGREVTGAEIYNNTISIGSWTDQAVWIDGHSVQARFCNNVFVSNGSAVPLRVIQPENRLRFEHNLYWREGGPVQVQWDAQTFATLEAWRAGTRQETVSGNPSGLFANPGLSTHPDKTDTAKEIGISNLRAYWPTVASPALAGGANLKERYGLEMGPRDLLGRAISKTLPLGAICGAQP